VGRRLIRSLTRLRQDRLIAKSFPRGDLPMIASLSLILLCQLAGEVIVRGLGLPMPGPVLGLLFLLLLLLGRDRFVVLARGPLQGDGVENASRGFPWW
jgi:LrgA family